MYYKDPFENYLRCLHLLENIKLAPELDENYSFKYYSIDPDTREISCSFNNLKDAILSLPKKGKNLHKYLGISANEGSQKYNTEIAFQIKKSNRSLKKQAEKLKKQLERFHNKYGVPSEEQINRGYF